MQLVPATYFISSFIPIVFFPYMCMCRFNQILDKNCKLLAYIRKTMPKNIEFPASWGTPFPFACVFSTFSLVIDSKSAVLHQGPAIILPGVPPRPQLFLSLRSAPLPKTSICDNRILTKSLYTVISQFASFKYGMPVIAPHPF